MERLILVISTLFLSSLTITNSFAQDIPPAPCTADCLILKCGELDRTKYRGKTIQLGPSVGPDKITKAAAIAKLQEEVEALLSCDTTDCPPELSCEPNFIQFLTRPPVTTDLGIWRNKRLFAFKWECTDCKEQTLGSIMESEKQTQFRSQSSPNLLHSSSQAQIKKLSPNPSTGIFQIDLQVDQAESKVDFTLQDISGKVIEQISYPQMAPSSFTTFIDLTGKEDGIYFLTIKVNQVLIGHRKIILSQ